MVCISSITVRYKIIAVASYLWLHICDFRYAASYLRLQICGFISVASYLLLHIRGFISITKSRHTPPLIQIHEFKLPHFKAIVADIGVRHWRCIIVIVDPRVRPQINLDCP